VASGSKPPATWVTPASHAGFGLSIRGQDPQNGLGGQWAQRSIAHPCPQHPALPASNKHCCSATSSPLAGASCITHTHRAHSHSCLTAQLTLPFNSLVEPLLAEARVKAAGLFMYWSQTFTYNCCSSNNN